MQRPEAQKREMVKASGIAHQPNPSADGDVLFEMIEERMQVLTNILAGPHMGTELQAEAASLSSLVETLSLRVEFIAKLLNGSTSVLQREALRASMQAMHIEPSPSKEEMLARSNELIKKAAALIARAQETINKEAYRSTGYAIKICGLCKGITDTPDDPCVVCKGKGSVIMREPSIRCPRCEGNGKTRTADKAVLYSSLCVECSGTGWMITRNN